MARMRTSAPGTESRALRESAGGTDKRGAARVNEVCAMVSDGMARIARPTAALYKAERDAEAPTAGRRKSTNRGD